VPRGSRLKYDARMSSSISDAPARWCLALATLLAGSHGLVFTFGSGWLTGRMGWPEQLALLLPETGVMALAAALGLALVWSGGPQRQLPVFVVVGVGTFGVSVHQWAVVAGLAASTQDHPTWLAASGGAYTVVLLLVCVAFWRLRTQIVSSA